MWPPPAPFKGIVMCFGGSNMGGTINWPAYLSLVVSAIALYVTLRSNARAQIVRLAAYRNIAYTATRFIPGVMKKAAAGEFDDDMKSSFETITAALNAIDFGQINPTELVVPFIHITHMAKRAEIIWRDRCTDAAAIGLVTDSTLSCIGQIDAYLRSKKVPIDEYAKTPPFFQLYLNN
jgi:hypothetical protein